MPPRTKDWTITPLTIDALPTALGPSPSSKNTTVLTHTNRQSSAMPESATLPPMPTARNSSTNTHLPHGFTRSSLASTSAGQENGKGRTALGKGFAGLAESRTTVPLPNAGHSERQISNTYSEQGRSQGMNNIAEMGNVRKTVRRAQALGLIKTMPSSLASTSTISLPESMANSVLSSVTASRNGSFAEGASSESETVNRYKETNDSPISDNTSTPKASLYRARDASSASSLAARKVSPFRQFHGYDLNPEMHERAAAFRSASFGSSTSAADQMSMYDGGMVASTGWLITVVPPDSLFYALSPETTSDGPGLPSTSNENIGHASAPNPLSPIESVSDGLDKVLSAARLRKWRKGKLMPLVPDMKRMMKAVAREWNLPSDAGMEMFLSSGRKAAKGNRRNGQVAESGYSDGEADSDADEETGGLLGEETWRMVWAEYIAGAESKRTRVNGTSTQRLHPSRSISELSRRIPIRTARDHDLAQHQDTAATVGVLSGASPIPEASPTTTEPPSTGNTFGMASQISNGSLQEVIGQDQTEDLPQIVHVAENGQQDPNIASLAYHQGALTPESSQMFFPNLGHNNSYKNEQVLPAAHALLSPSPSSVFPGGSVSQQASPLSMRRPSDNGGSLQNMTQGRRVLGRIEFDFDSAAGGRGEWYAKWLKRKVEARYGSGECRTREEGDSAARGLRPLQLMDRQVVATESLTGDDASDAESQYEDHDDAGEEYAPLMDEDEDENEQYADEPGVDDVNPDPQQSPPEISNTAQDIPTTKRLTDDSAAHNGNAGEMADMEIDHLVANALTNAFPDGPDDFVQAFTAGHAIQNRDIGEATCGKIYNWKDIGSQQILDERVGFDQLGGAPSAESGSISDDTEEVRQMLASARGGQDDDQDTTQLVPTTQQGPQGLLASPIDLPSAPQNVAADDIMTGIHPNTFQAPPARVGEPIHGLGMGIQMEDQGKRGSALVISSQLDVLEQALRDLSPRDIRFSMYPGAPAPFLSEAMPPMNALLEPSPAMNNRALQRFSDSTEQSMTETSESVETPAAPEFLDTVDLRTPAPISEPAFQQTPEAHPLPRHPMYTPRSAPEGISPIPLSLETMTRMEYETQASSLPKKSPGWKPRRPARPPSPHLEQYTAPSPHLKLSDTPPPASITVIDTRSLGRSPDPPDAAMEARPRIPSAGSKGMNKLNKLFHRRVSEKADTIEASMNQGGGAADTLADFGISGKSPKTNDSFGRRLFKGLHVKSPSAVQEAFPTTPTPGTAITVISDPVVVSTTNRQAYQLSQLQEQQASPPSLMSPPAAAPQAAVSPGSTIAPRTGSAIPHSPSLDTLPSHQASPNRQPFPISPSLNTIMSSPASPSLSTAGGVRRKPVPRRQGDDYLPTSQSTHSVTSFVLEEAPKRVGKKA
ncbi:hypothetical protein QFC21_007298 [Naganishia friedmannii]|uniref:Uncharacterized protein n=1 Tax=Naganishia friedmannii TaxID=89922 RepID=A0ACC2UVW1_9TREE|nr:hypothetical protein QFC21_007298 [Naganishia friedmannii]